jgi:hypothetical protein
MLSDNIQISRTSYVDSFAAQYSFILLLLLPTLGMTAKVDTLIESNRLQHGTSAAEGAFVHHYHATARGNVTGASAAIVCVMGCRRESA